MLWREVRFKLRSLIFARRVFRQDSDIGRSLQLLAEREQRPVEEVAEDLLAGAVAQREHAETVLARWHELSPREQQVTALICLNLTNSQIAERLIVAPETVKSHVRNVFNKLNLRRKTEVRQMFSDWDFSAWEDIDLRW
jgi:DNA-binding CsgD family transcriptional regulator